MISIERTAYPRFHRKPSARELRELYTPTLADVDFVNQTSRGPAQKFGLMILRQPSINAWATFPSLKPFQER